MHRIIGIDPGLVGAAALYIDGAVVPTVPGGLFDLPTVGDGASKEIDYVEMRNRIYALKPDAVFIEQQTAFVPKKKNEETGEMEADAWGAASMAKFMGTYYALRAVVICLEIPLRSVMPAVWKRGFNLPGGKKEKDKSRLLAVQRYPACHPFLKLKKDQHKAEAFLIAVYGARMWRREEENLHIPN